MGLIEVKKDFSRRELLWFGPLFALFVGIIGGWIFIRQLGWHTAAYGLWAAAAVLILVYYLIPTIRKPVYMGWIYAVMPIGWVISHLLLGAIFYLVVTPIGLAMRLLRYDPMHREFDREATSYWIERRRDTDVKSYFKQY